MKMNKEREAEKAKINKQKYVSIALLVYVSNNNC